METKRQVLYLHCWHIHVTLTGLEVVKLFFMFNLTEHERQIKKVFALSLSDGVFIMLINVNVNFNIYELDNFRAQLS